MNLFPLFADLHDRPALVVGGGAVARRKAAALRRAGARVTVGAPALEPELRDDRDHGHIRHRPGRFEPAWLDEGPWLVIAATDDPDLNAEVAAQATARRILVNVVDAPDLCTFQVPCIVDRSPLVVAVSSGGSAPVLARRVRAQLEILLGPSLGALAALAGRYRRRIRARHRDLRRRRRFYDWLHDGPVADLLRKGCGDDAERVLRSALDEAGVPPRAGRVTLAGAGPGDPGLLTLNAMRALQDADVILYDRLVGHGVLDLARRDATFVEVGKRPGEDHASTQARIHDLLVTHARDGRHVLRLKGGDPFVFGRGGEELEHLRAHGIDYAVIPGITAASACAAYAGVPLTHRDHAQSVRLLTAHCRDSLDTLDWPALAGERQTLAVYMGVARLGLLADKLIQHGRAPGTPFALVENGTRPEQRVISGCLNELARLAERHDIQAPALLIVGEVAALAPRLGWFGPPARAGTAWPHAA